MSSKIAPNSILFWNRADMKSPGAGGISVFKNCRKVKYCRISNSSNKEPIHEPKFKLLAIEETAIAVAATAPTATPTIEG